MVRSSDSPWSAPVVLVTKKDGGTRFCVDYHRLNLATVKDAYPLPRIDDTLDMLAGKRWFSTLDLASGYWQVSLSPEARCKTAFATHSGLFQFKVMPFGLCNAPATFERLMDRVLQGLRCSRCLVYLDDIISFGTTFDDALDNLTLIFERLRSYGLQLKSTKCHLFQTSVPFRGHVVGRRGLECDPRKITDVKSWPVQDCLKSVRQFIPNFADLAEPLVSLTGEYVPFIWRPACTDAFTGLRDALVRARFDLFQLNTEITYWIQTLATLAWEESSVKYRITWNASSPIAVGPYDHPNGNIAPQRGKCWLLSPCVYSFVHIYEELSSHSVRITSL